MATLNSKISKAILLWLPLCCQSCMAKCMAHHFTIDIPSQTVLNSSIRDLLMALSVFIVLSIVVKPQKECLFLGLESNFAKGFLVAIISVLPLYIVFPIIGTINPDLTFSLLVRKSLLPIHRGTFMPCLYVWIIFPICKNRLFWATLFLQLYLVLLIPIRA